MATFVGRYEHSLDGKGRIILPARFRTNFDSLAFVSKHNERCLAIWTPDAFEAKAADMAAKMDGSPQERAEARAWAAGTNDVNLDGQGRVALPQHLREFADLGDNSTVLVQGAITHIELWNPERWAVQEASGDASLGGEGE